MEKLKYCLYSFLICSTALIDSISMVVFTGYYPSTIEIKPKKIKKPRKLNKEKAYSHFNRLFER